MFWRYMADKKLIDVKPTRKEILYGFFCTGISLVLLIIFGITIVIFANKYMQNMKGNQNYLENLSLTTTTTEETTTTTTTTPSELFIFVNDDNDNENEYYLSTKMTTTNEINAAKTTKITPKIFTETMKTKEKISSFEITDNNKRINKVKDLVTTEIPLAEQNDDDDDDDGDDDDEDDDDGMMVATTATLVKHRIDFETPELLLTSGEGISSDVNGIDYSEMKIEEITKSDLKKFYRINNESIDKNVS